MQVKVYNVECISFVTLYTHMHVRTRFIRVKVYNVEFFVTCGFVMRTHAIKQPWHTRHAPHEQTRHERTFS